MLEPRTFTPDEVAYFGSYFAKRAEAALADAARADDALECRDLEACARTWTHAASVINQTVRLATHGEATDRNNAGGACG